MEVEEKEKVKKLDFFLDEKFITDFRGEKLHAQS